MVITKKESFGPVAPLDRFKTDAEAIRWPTAPPPCLRRSRGRGSGEGAAKLWFGGEIGFAGFEVDRHRDVLVNDEPAGVRFLVAVGRPHGEVELLALLVGTGHVLNAVAIGEVAIGDDVEIGQLDGDRAIEAAEKILPVLAVGRGADILP